MTMEVAAGTLGHLVRSGGALTADIVETEVRHLLAGSGSNGEDVTLDEHADSILVSSFCPRKTCIVMVQTYQHVARSSAVLACALLTHQPT